MNKKLPPNWSWVKLGDYIEKIPTTGKKLKQKEYLIEGKYPVVDQGKELVGGFSNDQELLLNCNLPVIVFGDHTKAKKLIPFNFIPGADGVKVIKPNKEFDTKLFYYFLHVLPIPDKGYSRHFQYVEKSHIPLPPLPEQHRIVDKIEELFSELDNGIENLKKAKAQIKTYRQAVLKFAFEGKLIQGEGKKVKGKSENRELPEGWELVALGEFCDKVSNAKDLDPNFEFLYLDIGGIDNKINKIVSHKEYQWKDAPSRAKQLVHEGDLLFSTVRTYLKNIALVPPRYSGQIASTGFCVIRPKKHLLLSEYIFHLTLYEKFLEPLNALQTGSSYPAVRDKDVFSQKIPLPPLKKQIQIVEEIERRFSVADKLEAAIDESLKKSEALRQSILKQAFEGKLV
ncbi:MAG: restriction endonuclease subunit S [Melioribacteraceae bacterium]|nr:MAG: restriction endonuclease subunit S [Melioribacteraceae bacterium]